MNQSNSRSVSLIILDGWGYSPDVRGNTIAMARTPNYDQICERFPTALLRASGSDVGLRPNESGNAEIGHVNLGAGRIVQTDAVRIADAIANGTFLENQVLSRAFAKAGAGSGTVHFVGLLSGGGVHSSTETLYELLRMAKRHDLKEVKIHAILDGRDVPPKTADAYLEALELKISDIGVGRVATVCGRYFAMDNAENWDRTARAFTMLVHAEGEFVTDAVSAVRGSFVRGISDEFIAPIIVGGVDELVRGPICSGDLVVFFNHRADTMRQLVRSLAVPEPSAMGGSIKPAIDVVCLTEYDREFGLPVAFPRESISQNMASIFADNAINNYRVSEADRFPHVTTFFNGGSTASRPNEMHLQIAGAPRPVDRFSEPEMRSFKIADALIRHLEGDPTGVFIANFPAPGIVAETGDLERTIEAVQYIDTCLGGLVEKIREVNGSALITSTHGNCEAMLDASGKPNRSATRNDVPLILVDDESIGINLDRTGSLKDVAPTMLGLLGLEPTASMTGKDLRFSQE